MYGNIYIHSIWEFSQTIVLLLLRLRIRKWFCWLLFHPRLSSLLRITFIICLDFLASSLLPVKSFYTASQVTFKLLVYTTSTLFFLLEKIIFLSDMRSWGHPSSLHDLCIVMSSVCLPFTYSVDCSLIKDKNLGRIWR